MCFEKNFKLKYLNLDAIAEEPEENFDIGPNLAASCYNLEKLHFNCKDGLPDGIHPKVFKCIIQNSDTLTVLSLPICQLKFDLVKQIFIHCNKLLELDIGSGNWCERSINVLCENLTDKIEKLDVSGQLRFGNKELKKLLIRCKKLTEFAFSYTPVSNVDTIIENLSDTLIKIEVPNEMSSSKHLKLASMPNLKVFCFYEQNLKKRIEKRKRIKRAMPHLKFFPTLESQSGL